MPRLQAGRFKNRSRRDSLMKLFKKIAIVGTGLIGGSLGLAIKKRHLANEVVGVSRQKKSIVQAVKIGAIDRGAEDCGIIEGSDAVVLAMPVGVIIGLAPMLSKFISSGCVVTDAGSTKKEIVAKLSKLYPGFIGSHPLTGSEKRGIANARPHLFENSLCIVTPVKSTKKESVVKTKKLWESVGAKVVLMSPAKHDSILSYVSHLPHFIAFSLMNSLPFEYIKFSPQSFRDMTRIAASDVRIWQDIALSNTDNVIKAIDVFQKKLSAMKSAISKQDRDRVYALLQQAKMKKESVK